MYTTCEAGKRRTVNHTRARSLASPGRAGPGRGRGRGAARPDGRCGARARARARPDVTCRCGAVRCDVMC